MTAQGMYTPLGQQDTLCLLFNVLNDCTGYVYTFGTARYSVFVIQCSE